MLSKRRCFLAAVALPIALGGCGSIEDGGTPTLAAAESTNPSQDDLGSAVGEAQILDSSTDETPEKPAPPIVDLMEMRPSADALDRLDLEYFSTEDVGSMLRLRGEEQVIEHRYVTTGASPGGRQPEVAILVRLVTGDRLVSTMGKLEESAGGLDAERRLERRRIGDHEGWIVRSSEDDMMPGSGFEEVGFIVEGRGAVSVVNLQGASIDALLAVAESVR